MTSPAAAEMAALTRLKQAAAAAHSQVGLPAAAPVWARQATNDSWRMNQDPRRSANWAEEAAEGRQLSNRRASATSTMTSLAGEAGLPSYQTLQALARW